ncbi:hypothetical protein C6988_10225, partial [Nitrosopumilus sp. b1]|uniref:LamG-like jellyroll fold domain-containing protein n=1 Tax=Nitrosopumilus sp. b1 TaxID=2109907 RepID=UPI001CE93AD5
PQPSNVTAQPQPSNVTAQPQPTSTTNSSLQIILVEHLSPIDNSLHTDKINPNEKHIYLSENVYVHSEIDLHESHQHFTILSDLGIMDNLLLKINNVTMSGISEKLSIQDSLNLYLNDVLIEHKIHHYDQTLRENLGFLFHLPIDPVKIILPNVTESWINENQTDNVELIGDAKIQNDTETDLTTIILDGDYDFAETIPTNTTTYITNMTISAWVKPDYTKGSDEFTIISKAKSFVLSINNVLSPQKIAKFSVFDGIKWTSIESKSQITNGWTHLAASFNKSAIAIYVNGTIEGSIPVNGIPYITTDGQISIKTVDEITSQNDLVIGAAVTPDMKHSAENLYSGMIADVEFYDSQLTPNDIRLIFTANTPTTRISLFDPEQQIFDEPVSILPESITNSTDMQTEGVLLSTNGTEPKIIAANEENLNNDVSTLTVSSWIKPNYTQGSSEFTIVGKENSFVLSVNKLIPPERVAKFSVFDGISWTTITGEQKINDWSHVVGVINKTKISLYVNGTLAGTANLPEQISFSQGKLNITHANAVTSQSDIVIGALINTQRDEPRFSNYFSGVIGDASVYKQALTKEQIQSEFDAYVLKQNPQKISWYTISLSENISITIEQYGIPFDKGIPENKTNDSLKQIQLQESLVLGDSLVTIPVQKISVSIYESLGIDSHYVFNSDVSHQIILVENISISESVYTQNPLFPYHSDILVLDDELSLFLNGKEIVEARKNLSLLTHNDIEIGKIVIWTQTILVNDTDSIDSVLVEIPADAQDIEVEILNENKTMSVIPSELITILEENEIDEEYPSNDLSEKLEERIQKQLEKIEKFAKKINATNIASLDLAVLKDLKHVKQHEKPSKFLIFNDTKLNLNEDNHEKTTNKTKSEKELLIQFVTPAPYKIENDYSTSSKFQRNVTVAHNSTLHYTNVKTYTDLPEYLVQRNIAFKLHWMINDTKVDVTFDPRFNIQFVDTDSNGIADRMQWTVPQLSEQEFEVEAEINIINVQSYPLVGGYWTVNFTTVGNATLTVSAIDGTTFGESAPDDLEFIDIKCGENIVSHQWVNGSVVVENYSCYETGSETSKVLTSGKHHLKFQFGNDVGYAHNMAFANRVLGVTKVTGTYTSAGSTQDFTITPNLVNANKAYALCSFRHAGENTHAAIFKAWEILNTSTLRIHATTNTTPTQTPFVCYITEYDAQSSMISYQLSNTRTSTSAAVTLHTANIGATIEPTESMEWFQGHTHDGGDTTIGTEELDRARIISSTQWQWEVNTGPNSQPQDDYLGIVDWNDSGVSVQRGQTTIAVSGTTRTLTGGVDFTAVDRDRTLLFTSFKKSDTGFTYDPSTSYISATLDASNNIVFQRNAADSNTVDINWTLVQFPEYTARIQHELVTLASGTSTTADTITSVGNMSKTLAIGTVCSPFGCGTGRTDTTTGGAIDRLQATLELTAANEVTITRGDSTGSFTIGYQVAEFGNLFVRTIADSASTSDSISKEISFARSMTDITNTGDSFDLSTSFVRSISDSLSTSDTSVVSRSFTRSMTDSVSSQDTLSADISFTRSITDSASTADSITTPTSFARLFTDSLSTADSLTTPTSFTREMTDSVSSQDTLSADISFTRSITDSASTADSITTPTSFARLFADSASTADSITTSTSFARLFTDSLSTADSLTTSTSFTRAMTDTLSAQDSVSRVISFGRSITDSLSTADSITTSTSFARIFTDTATADDSLTTSTSFNRFMTDTLSTADSLLASVQFTRIFTDTATADDSITTSTSFARLFADSASTADSLTTSTSFARLFTDSLSTADSLTTSTSFIRAMTDTLSTADSSLGVISFNRSITDSASTADSITTSTSFARIFTDTATADDSITTST